MSALKGPERPPASGGAPRKLVLLLHGLGADGNDLIGLAEPWGRLVPHACFAAPDAPEPCDMAPMGRQWFSLSDRSPASMAEGVARAAEALNADIDARLESARARRGRPRAGGFQPGHDDVAPRRLSPRRALRRRTGLLGPARGRTERLGSELRARPPALLIHGDADDLVPVGALFEAATILGACEVPVQWHVSRGIGHGIAPDGLEIGGRFLRDVLGGAG